jgi:ATP-dependent Clp protease ATP-binding subunit ClpB
MSAFDEGYIKTNKGKIVDFSKAIIIATTNAAHKDHKNSLGFTQGETKSSNKSEIKDLSQWFDTELLNRFDTIVTFNELSKDIYREIIADTYHREAERILSENKKIKLAPDMPDADLDKIVEDTYIPSFGARPAGKAVRQYIEDHA